MSSYWTIPNFELMSKQELFDMSAAHILSTRQKSAVHLRCVYSGSGCAAAPFLTPQGRLNLRAGWRSLVISGDVPEHEEQLIRQLQIAHDEVDVPSSHFLSVWKANMRLLAADFGLSPHLIDNDDKVNGHG